MRAIAIPVILFGYFLTLLTGALSSDVAESIGSVDRLKRKSNKQTALFAENESSPDYGSNLKQQFSLHSMLMNNNRPKRAYIMTTVPGSAKRLPSYDFGMGKRSSPSDNDDASYDQNDKRNGRYDFGLGKRTNYETIGKENYNDDELGLENLSNDAAYSEYKPNLSYEQLRILLPLLYQRHDDDDEDFLSEKRARPYSFGLGKRAFQSFKFRRNPGGSRYNFGLGR